MSILVDRSTKVITQGMTGETGTFDAAKELLVACKAIDDSLG